MGVGTRKVYFPQRSPSSKQFHSSKGHELSTMKRQLPCIKYIEYTNNVKSRPQGLVAKGLCTAIFATQQHRGLLLLGK